MKRCAIQPALFVAIVLAYLVLALPLPAVLLDHELGLLTGDPAHTTLDDHAWLDHTVGSGMASGEAGIVSVDLIADLIPPVLSCCESSTAPSPSVRGPPVC